MKYLFSILFAALIALSGTVNTASAEVYVFRLDGMQANAGQGTGSEATGIFFLHRDEETGVLEIWGEHNVENATVGHIHFAPRGQNGGVVFPFASGASPVHEIWEMDSLSTVQLESGLLYVNIHSEAHGGGEIRGQIEPGRSGEEEPMTFTFFAQPYQANAGEGTDSEAFGNYTLFLGAAHDVIVIGGSHSVQNATVSHIHMGPMGENGDVVFPLPVDDEFDEQIWFPTEEEVAALLAGNLYVNVHSETYPGGEIRGQIIQSFFDYEIEMSFSFMANGMQAGNESAATGDFLVLLNRQMNTLLIWGKHNVASPTVAHIHRAVPGQNGPVVFPFAGGSSPIREKWYLTPEDVTDLMEGRLYVNIHSELFGGGEIRGQIVMTEVDTTGPWMPTQVMLDGMQANAGDGTGSEAIGLAMGMLAPDSSRFLFWGVHTAAFPTVAHIHEAPVRQNGDVVFPLNLKLGTFDGVWFLNPEQATALLIGNTYVNVHTVAFGGGEIRGQIEFQGQSVRPEDGYGAALPVKVELAEAFPNPFNSSVRLTANLPFSAKATLAVYDLSGREVARLIDGNLQAGAHSVMWDAVDMPTGVYIAKLKAAGVSSSLKLVLTK